MGREADGGVTASMGLAVSPGEDGVVILQLDDSTDPRTALKAFLAEDGVDGGRIRDSTDRGVTTSRATFETATEDGTLRGEAAFIQMDGTLYSLVGTRRPRPGVATLDQ